MIECIDWDTGERIAGVFYYDAMAQWVGRMVDGSTLWETRRLAGFRLCSI